MKKGSIFFGKEEGRGSNPLIGSLLNFTFTNNLNVHYTKECLFGEKLDIELHTSLNLDRYSERMRSWVYFIPINDIVFQLNFSDLENDKCNDLYDNIVNGLKQNLKLK